MLEDLKTCLNEERLNEEKYTFKYPENDYDETKMLKVIKEKEKVEDKETKSKDKKKKKDEIIVKDVSNKNAPGQNKILIILLSIFTSLVLIITCIMVLIPVVTKKNQVAIPDVSNKSLKQATKILQDKGFVISEEQVEKASETVKEGYVIKTDPIAGTKRKKGYEVTIYVSLGDAKIVVENYTGKDFSEVKGALESQKIKVIKEIQEVEKDDSAKENEIIGQSVEVGTKMSVGDTITLYVADTSKKYPNFCDGTWTEAKVRTWAAENGVELEKVLTDTADGLKNDVVIRQSLPEGYKVLPGQQKFNITIVKNEENQNTEPEDGDGDEWI